MFLFLLLAAATQCLAAENSSSLAAPSPTASFFQEIPPPKDADLMTSRFILTSDRSTDTLAGIKLHKAWWSRPHEYAWAAQFADSDAIALDAACGISHPFKWYLGKSCKETWACDSDTRIIDIGLLSQETYDDLGEEAYETVINTRPWERVNLVHQSILNLSDNLPKFSRIFCISVLEHMDPTSRKLALIEFSKVLSPDGLIILTVDYPVVTPQELFEAAETAGLVAAGPVELALPNKNALHNTAWYIYRCVLKHSSRQL